jgi:hypothetical protein
MKYIFTLLLLALMVKQSHGQHTDYKLKDYRYTTPVEASFLKYTDMPVSEFTGIPNIAIPLHGVKISDVDVSLQLSYHAAGIKVSQEASWVGMGWDLQFGSIVQHISDVDDYMSGTDASHYSSPGSSLTQMRADYVHSPFTSFHRKFNKFYYGCSGVQPVVASDWTNTIPVTEAAPFFSYGLYTDYKIPINGDRNNTNFEAQYMSTSPTYDSEPDIFTANFLGHSIKFVKKFNSSQIIVLNKKGYKVEKVVDGFSIATPNGDKFYFQISTYQLNLTSSGGGAFASLGGGAGAWRPGSRMFMLTKVITRDKQNILFDYTIADGWHNNLPGFSQKLVKNTGVSYNTSSNNWLIALFGYPTMSVNNSVESNYTESSEKAITLNSITIPDGKITFFQSTRIDVNGNQKLDSILITNSDLRIIKKIDFHYEYHQANTSAASVFSIQGTSFSIDKLQKRLFLRDVVINKTEEYSFTYDAEPLPPKNSFAQDYWGYYNGALANTSLAPNPARLSAVQRSNVDWQMDNGNNNSAQLQYARAGNLISIKYPTGGNTVFEYELNEFDNVLLPNYSNINNTSTQGNGLRIKNIQYLSGTNGSNSDKTTSYNYINGKLLQYFQLGAQFSLSSVFDINLGQRSVSVASISYAEMGLKSFYSPGPLSTSSGVGYEKVIKKEIASGIDIGRTESFYNISFDNISPNAGSSAEFSSTLPAVKKIVGGVNGYDPTPETGTRNKLLEFSSNNELKRKVEDTYYTNVSELEYGARIFSFSSIWFSNDCGDSYIAPSYGSATRQLIGFYPIYDVESRLGSTEITLYNNGNELKQKKSFSYNNQGQIAQTSTETSNGDLVIERFDYAYEYQVRTGNSILLQNNILSDVTEYIYEKRPRSYFPIKAERRIQKEYALNGTQIVTTTHKNYPSGINGVNPIITNYGYTLNTVIPSRISSTNGQSHSFVLNTQGNKIMAECTNAKENEIFHYSFEETNQNDWDSNLTAVDNTKSKSGKQSGRIDNPNPSEKYTHSNTWLQIGNNTSKRYKYSVWVYSTASSAQIFLFMKRAGETAYNTYVSERTTYEQNKWVLLEGEYDVPADITELNIRLDNNGNGTVWFDDVRLHPSDAMMTTYTYEPLVGISSQTDANNKTTYYFYDAFNRLSLVKDRNGNVLKRICYNYQGQPEVCYSQPATVVVPPPPPTTIYVRLRIEDPIYYWDATYANIVVYFYADANGTVPLTVNNLAIDYQIVDCSGFANNLNATANGVTSLVLQTGTPISNNHYYNWTTGHYDMCDYGITLLGSANYSIIP